MNTRTALAANDNEPEGLPTKEAAERLGIRVRHVYHLIDEGRLSAYKFGRVIRLRGVRCSRTLAGESQDPDKESPDA